MARFCNKSLNKQWRTSGQDSLNREVNILDWVSFILEDKLSVGLVIGIGAHNLRILSIDRYGESHSCSEWGCAQDSIIKLSETDIPNNTIRIINEFLDCHKPQILSKLKFDIL